MRPENVWRKSEGGQLGCGEQGQGCLDGALGSKRSSDPGSCCSESLTCVWSVRGDQVSKAVRASVQRKPASPSQSLESAAMLLSRGSLTWTTLMWKHLQHISLGEVWKLRWAPGDWAQAGTPEHVCFYSSNPESTLYTNKLYRQTWGEAASPEVANRESSHLTRHLTLTPRTWSPVLSDYETFVPTRIWLS